MEPVAKLFEKLAEHADILHLLVEVLESGSPKDAVRRALEAAMIQASDEAMRAELGSRG